MKALVLGGSGGIGSALIRHLLANQPVDVIHATHFRSTPPIEHDRLCWHQTDARDSNDIETLCAGIDDIQLCINTVGMLHDDNHLPEKTIRKIDDDYFFKSMAMNALPTLLLARHIEPSLRHGRTAHFATVSARVGSIGENRLGGWYSYRASKAALNMILKTLSIEWKRSLPKVIVSALHPGTTDTALSRPFQKNVPAGDLFPPDKTAAYLIELLQRLQPQESGNFWSFDGQKLPW